jgi:hypothetical protein
MDLTGWLVLLALLGTVTTVTGVRALRRTRPAREFLHLGLREKVRFGRAVSQDGDLPLLVRIIALPLVAVLIVACFPMPLPLRWSVRFLLLFWGIAAFVLLTAIVPRSRLESAAGLATAEKEAGPLRFGPRQLLLR